MKKIDSFFKKVVFAERALAAFVLFVMLIICVLAVVMRYVFNNPLIWSEEVTLVLLVLVGFLCISVDIYGDEHIALTFLYDKLPPFAQRALDVLRHVLIGAFFLLMTNYGFKIYAVKASKQLAATGWSQGLVYIFQITISIIAVIFCIINVLKVFPLKPETKESEATEK